LDDNFTFRRALELVYADRFGQRKHRWATDVHIDYDHLTGSVVRRLKTKHRAEASVLAVLMKRPENNHSKLPLPAAMTTS